MYVCIALFIDLILNPNPEFYNPPKGSYILRVGPASPRPWVLDLGSDALVQPLRVTLGNPRALRQGCGLWQTSAWETSYIMFYHVFECYWDMFEICVYILHNLDICLMNFDGYGKVSRSLKRQSLIGCQVLLLHGGEGSLPTAALRFATSVTAAGVRNRGSPSGWCWNSP